MTPTYSAPALEKALDILELLAESDQPLSQSGIAESLDRSVGEIFRVLQTL
jgi:DNA-binding IclR family transcriptional regulator